jgi:uncharacterized protein YceK
MKSFVPLALALAATTLLSGCGAMHTKIERANNAVYEGSQKTRAKIAKYIYDDSQVPVPPPHPVRYCYDVRADVVCYDQPTPQLSTQRVGTGVEDASSGEFEVSQLYNAGSQRSNGSMVGAPTSNLDVFFNPAQPNQNNLRFNSGAGVSQGNTFVPPAPAIRGVEDPVSNVPTQQKPFGFSQASPSRNRSPAAPTATMGGDGSGGPATMNTQGPPPTKPPAGFGAPSPLIQNY